ncbi:hypothetical protein ZHAS_00022061 [Anopheles sinensis]|uniref:Uncharacterized protein n=1 Tax=Anopheles sinensis TaxID=74873 RepID=A0A084WUC6_ANOSI|nr:hypothetical protein ZHAS_00022061 [Anopheles sinensis]
MTSEADDAWAYIIDNNEETWKRRKEGDTRNAQFFKNLANELQKYDYKSFTDADLKRRIFKLTKIGYQALSEDKLNQLIDVITRINTNYNNVNVCQFQNETNCNIKVVVTLNSEWKMMAKSRDPEELKHYWVQWHDAAGKPVRKDFEKYVTLRQEAAQLNSE